MICNVHNCLFIYLGVSDIAMPGWPDRLPARPMQRRPSAAQAALGRVRFDPACFAITVDKTHLQFGHADAAKKNPHVGVLLVARDVPERVARSQSPAADA